VKPLWENRNLRLQKSVASIAHCGAGVRTENPVRVEEVVSAQRNENRSR
jgi:hypothetical protein